MTDFTTFTDKELSEALDFHRRQRNMSRGVNEAAHMRQTQTVRLLEAEETRRLEEAKKLKPGHNAMVLAKNIAKVTAAIKKEEVEQIDELSKKTLGSYIKKASADQYFKGQDAMYHDNKAKNADGPFAKETKKKHYDLAAKANEKASNRDTGIGRAIDRMTKEEVSESADSIHNLAIQSIQSKLKKAKVSYRDPNAKTAREEDRLAKQLAAKAKLNKEEIEINESTDLRITKIYNKWPKKATYAVHSPDRKYFKEFDSMEAAKAHHDEKSGK